MKMLLYINRPLRDNLYHIYGVPPAAVKRIDSTLRLGSAADGHHKYLIISNNGMDEGLLSLRYISMKR